MALIRIGETLHCHIPSVQTSARRLLLGDTLDREAGERHLRRIVQDQAAAGADYMDVNVDDFLIEDGIGRQGSLTLLGHIFDLIARYGQGIAPCIDSSDPALLEWGLERYCNSIGGAPPLVNSVTVTRLDLLKLRARFEFSIVGMLLERVGAVSGFTDIAGPEVYHETANFIFDQARQAGFDHLAPHAGRNDHAALHAVIIAKKYNVNVFSGRRQRPFVVCLKKISDAVQ